MQANEIFLKNGKSYFFNMFKKETNNLFFDFFSSNKYNDIIVTNLAEDLEKKNYTTQWQNNKLSTFDYLIYVNFYACRSFNDMNQYPVFPWLSSEDETDKFQERDFRYPICVQSEARRKKIKELTNRICLLKNFPNNFNSHYSTSAFVIYYLVRVSPFTQNMITFQNDKFDEPNRIFHSIFQSIEILQKYSDNRELIPEVFFFPELFMNLNFNVFGKRSDGMYVFNEEFKSYYENNKIIYFRPSNSPIEFISEVIVSIC